MRSALLVILEWEESPKLAILTDYSPTPIQVFGEKERRLIANGFGFTIKLQHYTIEGDWS